VFRCVGTLSLGERMRLSLAVLIARGADVLLLDEPTNHLDLDSREQVEEALSLFEGTVLMVSHDRYFLERFAERIVALEDRSARVYELSYEEYRNRARQLEWVQSQAPGQDLAHFQSLQTEALLLERRLADLGTDLGRAAGAAKAEYQETSQRLQEVRAQLAGFPQVRRD